MKLTLSVLVASGLALGFSMPSMAADPIKIGVSGPFTGGSAPMGVSMRDGVRLAAAEINAKGGVLGRQIQLVERDDEAKNGRGSEIAEELIGKEKVVATVGYINTGVALASQRLYQQAKIPVITNVAVGSVITKQFADQPQNYIFRNSASDSIQSEMIVQEAVERRKFTKVGIIADSTNYGQLGRADIEKALEKRGIKPVATEKYNIGEVDMTKQLTAAKQAGAEVIIVNGIGPELAAIANGTAKLGWQVPMVGSWTLSMANFIDNAGKNGDGTRMPQTFIQSPSTPKRKAFIDAYIKAYNPPGGRMPSAVSASQGYDSLYLLAAALKQAGDTDGTKIAAALENLNEKVEGVVTTYNKPYSHNDHEAIKPENVQFGEVRGGHVVLAK